MQQIEQMQNELERLKKLKEKYPDLSEYQGRWKKLLTSKDVNINFTTTTTGHSCGCCSDSPLYLYFLTDDNVYSNPPFICIGEKGFDGYDKIDSDEEIEKLLITNGINIRALEIVQNLRNKIKADKIAALESELEDLKKS